MHSCELIVTPPAQGAALLLELGTLIIEGRNSKAGVNVKTRQNVQLNVSDTSNIDKKETEIYANSDVGRGALPKRPATSLASVSHLSPAKRNRDHNGVDHEYKSIQKSLNDLSSKGFTRILLNKHLPSCVTELTDPEKNASTSQTPELSAYQLKARLANVGSAPLRGRAEAMWRDHTPLCIEVLLAPNCFLCREPLLLLERWTMSVYSRRSSDSTNFITSQWLLNAVRSQLHFSQISAWSAKLKEEEIALAKELKAKIARDLSPSERQRKLSRETCNFKKYESNCDDAVLKEDLKSNDKDDKKRKLNILYKLRQADDVSKSFAFQCDPLKHTFPITDIGSNVYLEVQLESLPRLEEIPFVKCDCSSATSDTPKRRKSKDLLSEPCFTEDILSRKLAVACCLVDKRSTDNDEANNRPRNAKYPASADVINLDMGSTSGLGKKFPLYSSPNVPEFGYHSLSSRGSTPERSDLNDVVYFSTKVEPIINSDKNPNPIDNNLKIDDSYQSQFSALSGDQVPLNKLISTDYLLVDDRMQTPCRQKGKHRCNCDDESDQGTSKDTKTNSSNQNRQNYPDTVVIPSGNSQDYDSEDYLGTGQKVISDDKKIKEMTRNLRRQRKENRLKHLKQSNKANENDHRENKKSDSVCGKKIRTTSSSENSDGRSSPELVHYHSVCHGCFCKHQEQQQQQQKHDAGCNSETIPDRQCSNTNDKSSDSYYTTSIPILQASKFDHHNRIACFRSGMRTPREFYCSKPQSSVVTVDQRSPLKCKNQGLAGVKSLSSADTPPADFQKCYCHTIASSKINDDDYRPSVKKLISSATQTDEMLCECGNILVPKCPECKNPDKCNDLIKNDHPSFAGMKRSVANHDLAAITKSNSVEKSNAATETRTVETACGSVQNSDSSCHDSAGECNRDLKNHDKKVIDYNCDNSVNILNNCECDKNIVYSDSFNNISCTNESLSNNVMPLISNNNDICNGDENASSTKTTDLSILVMNKSLNDDVQYSEPNSHIKTLLHKDKPPDVDAKNNFIIKKPKLKKSTPTIDKISIIVKDRTDISEGKPLNNNTSSTQNVDNKKIAKRLIPMLELTTDDKDATDEDQIVLYERSDYGTFTKTENNGNCILRVSDAIQSNLLKKYDQVKKKLFKENGGTNKPAAVHSSLPPEHSAIPSTSDMDKFRYRLDSAASMVFHSRTGLPLTSSPAPLRKGKSCFDYDSTINSVSGIKSALYGLSNADLETQDSTATWSPSSSPGSPSHNFTETTAFNYNIVPKNLTQQQSIIHNRSNKFRHGTSSGLLGSFEESVLNGRLEPTATVAGFTADIGASGEFCPPHLTLPVSVFFYSLGDNTTSSPYLGHINLGRKGYCVPRAGTIQVTLFNPHGTVVKMFVVMYNLEDMPPYSRTFLRQRTLWGGTCLRYLIHLRFSSSKSGKIYLHTDIRIIVSRKADLDTAAAHSLSSSMMTNNNEPNKNNRRQKVETGTFKKRTVRKTKGCCDPSVVTNNNNNNTSPVMMNNIKCDINRNKATFPLNTYHVNLPSVMSKELSYELRSFTYGPENPKYSPR